MSRPRVFGIFRFEKSFPSPILSAFLFWLRKVFESNICLSGQKNCLNNFFSGKNIYSKNCFGSKKFLVQKPFTSQKNSSRKKSSSLKRDHGKKVFVPQKSLRKKSFCTRCPPCPRCPRF